MSICKDNLLQLGLTYTDVLSPPILLSIDTIQEVLIKILINPPITVTNNAKLTGLSTTLAGFDFKIFYDKEWLMNILAQVIQPKLLALVQSV